MGGSLNLNTRLVEFPNGAKVPADEPAVATARAAHLNKKAGITISAPYGALVSHSNGAVVPADEPAVLLRVLLILTRLPQLLFLPLFLDLLLILMELLSLLIPLLLLLLVLNILQPVDTEIVKRTN